MKNIFISRPTYINNSFKKGLENFYSFLESSNLRPRSLGTTDYPTESPLNEVISILKKCNGIIILGYPQINIIEGDLKDKRIKNLSLSTEWNHIEASLAYMLNIPLLVIHHIGVTRGIFDRGTINSFIYEKDLTEPSWILEKDISGAFNTWKKKLELNKVNGNSINNYDFIVYRGGAYKKKKNGDIEDTVYCPDCKKAMFSIDDRFPFQCKCGNTSGFKRGEFQKIKEELKTEGLI